MSNQMRQRIVGIINAWITENGNMPLRVLKTTLRSKGIPESFLNNIQPKLWISNEFPEFRVIGTNGYEHIVSANAKEERVFQILFDAITKEGKYLLSNVSPRLASEGIEWRSLANGKKIYEWIQDSYPGVFVLSDDKLWLSMDNATPVPVPAPDPSPYETDQETKNFIYKFCFFPTNAAMLRLIKELSGDESLNQAKWASQRTFALAQCLIGLNGGILDDSDGEIPKLAFYTGLKTSKDQDIYGILVRNTNDGAPQKWIFSTVTFPGQDTEEGYWLCNTCGLRSQASYGDDRTKAINLISDALDKVVHIQRELSNGHVSIQHYIDEGQMFSDSIAELIIEYINNWGNLKKEILRIEGYNTEDVRSIYSVQQFLDEMSNTNKVQEELIQKFSTLARATWNFMCDNMLCPDDHSAKDISAWNRLLQKNNAIESISQLHQLLAPYQAVAVLRSFDPTERGVLDDTEYSAIDSINEHFNARLKLAQLRHSICNKEIDMSFLGLLSEINALILEIENTHNASTVEETLPTSDAELLDAALDGRLWRIADRVFHKPNILEKAIMLGDGQSVQDIVFSQDKLNSLGYEESYQNRLAEMFSNAQIGKTLTPLSAAKRLIQYMGNNIEIVDQCLLLSVMQHEEGSLEALLLHYIETGRSSLAGTLYNRVKTILPIESRRQIILVLISQKCINIDDALGDDMLVFMTESGVQLIKSSDINIDEDKKVRLLALFEKIQPTFIHHIVFLSPELQSYTLRPENAGELSVFFPETRRETVAELLQQNTFERGDNPLQIAKRVFAFIGNWEDIAFEFASFSEDNLERQEFLFNLLLEKDDDIEMIKFLDDNLVLQKEHIPFYCDLLFRNQMYTELSHIITIEGPVMQTKQILQGLFASLKLGEEIESIPEFDSHNAVEYPQLLFDISEELTDHNLNLFQELLVKVFPEAVRVFNEDELTRFVTANGTLNNDALSGIIEDTTMLCPSLTLYCGHLLNMTFIELRDSYLSALYADLSTFDSDEQKKIAHELSILDPEKYAVLEENIFDTQLTEILSGDLDVDIKAERISELLRNSNLSNTTLLNAINRIGESDVFQNKMIYRELLSYIKDDQFFVSYLKILYAHWDQSDEEYRIFFCNLVIEAEKKGTISDDLLVEYEDCLLSLSGSLNRRRLQECIFHMEELRGREPYLSFAKIILRDTVQGEIQESSSNLDYEWVEELSLFCDALENESVDINDYLRYCSKLTFESRRTSDYGDALEDADPVFALRKLYIKPEIADNWEAVERIIPQLRVRARGYALYYYAQYLGKIKSEDSWLVERNNENWTVGKANTAWERCVNYCMTEDLDDIFFMGFRSWLKEINDYYVQQLPWYSTKHYMQTMQKILEGSDAVLHGDLISVSSFPICSKETAVALIVEAIDIFKRIELNKTNQVSGDDNHNSLRVIIELSLRLDCEDLLLEKLSEELSGAYVNLGLVVVCRLLLTGKMGYAMRFLSHIVDSSVKNYNYASLMDSLVFMSEDELAQWMRVEGNRETLRFILPNGNAPDILRLQTLVMSTFNGDANSLENSIHVVENLMECYPRDVMIYKSLFIMCKEDYSTHLTHLYRALIGIYKYYHSKPRNMYTRDRTHVLTLIEILRQVMELDGNYNVVYESTTDLIRGYQHENDRVDTDELVSRLNQLSEEIKSLFIGVSKSSDAYALLMKSLLGSVTENWAPFFRAAFQIRAANLVQNFNIDKYKSTRGMLRGVLSAWQECSSDEERRIFISWINEEIALDKDSFFSKYAMKQLNNLITKISFQAVNWSMLRLPWEEHLVCLGNLKDISRIEKNCCYKTMMSERPKGQPAKDSFIVMIRVAQDNLKAQLLLGNARSWFRKGDYDLAGAAYEALAITRIIPTNDRTKAEEYFESYETWMRISYAFAGADPNSRNCSQHSCMNMICALLNTGYAKYFDRLRVSFTGLNLKLFKAVRRVLATPLNETEAVRLLSEFQREQERGAMIAYLHFLLSKDQTGRFLFISNQELIDDVTRRLSSHGGTQNSYKRNKYWISLQIRPLPAAFPQEEDQESNYLSSDVNIAIPIGTTDEPFVPRCYSELDSYAVDEDGRDIQDLLEEYNSLTPYSDGDCSKRLRLAALICVHSRSDVSEIESQKNLIRFCINYYKYHYNCVRRNENLEYSRERIHMTMLDLGVYGLQTPSVNAEIILSLPNWFQYSIRGFSSIDQLLQDYAQNRSAYVSIVKLLSDTEYSDAVNGLVEVLNLLLSATNRMGTNSLDIRTYQMAQSRLSEVSPTRDWVEMHAALNEMLRQEINKLDQRPSLKVSLFNVGKGLQNDGLYGEIENTGRETAYRVELQATFPNNESQQMSSLYRLASLRPSEKAVFAISYKASESIIELEYILNISYGYKEKRFATEPIHDRLTIVPSSVPARTIPPQFNTTIASSFTVNEEGKIISNDFKGRKSEILKLSGLLSGNDFSNYRSAIVQGIKRSGKTSLLNYLRTYIRAKKGDNTVHLFVDCQAISSKPYIYNAFFKSVLDELPLEYPQIMSHPGWVGFNSQWRLNDNSSDREPADMSLFFRQLHSMMNGKGLYLIFDEFDVLINRLDKDMGYDSLLQALRSLQMNPDCLESVHMVLCGSNHLLIYNQTGSIFNQMFQSYETIPVGQMLASDIQEMITDWLAQHPFIHFAAGDEDGTSPSIQWIERYTGGLVWYTRLLVNEAVRAVLNDKRDCVYPSDICIAFNSICNFNNCRQLAEGCGSDDKIVLDAMQSLADRPDMYVSYEHLMQHLEPYMNAEQVRRSLLKLTESVELLEQKSPSIRSYRFRIELYRRYFRTLEWLDNHESRFDNDENLKNQAGGDSFTIVESDSNIETVDSNSVFDFI